MNTLCEESLLEDAYNSAELARPHTDLSLAIVWILGANGAERESSFWFGSPRKVRSCPTLVITRSSAHHHMLDILELIENRTDRAW